MSSTVVFQNGNANAQGHNSGAACTQTGDITFHLNKLLRGIFPRKSWAYVGLLIGAKPRAAKHKLKGDRRYSADEVALLLQSEHGRKVLAVLMGEAKPNWYFRLLKQDAVMNARLHRLQAERELEFVLAERDSALALKSKIERTEAALLVQDAEFHGPDIDGLRHAGGADGCTVAPRTK